MCCIGKLANVKELNVWNGVVAYVYGYGSYYGDGVAACMIMECWWSSRLVVVVLLVVVVGDVCDSGVDDSDGMQVKQGIA